MDRELVVVDESDESVCHVFERADEPHYIYKYMTYWIEKNWTGDFTGMWDRAKKAWNEVEVAHRMFLWSVDQQKEQNFKDIREGLLATLKEYQGSRDVKELFEEALKDLNYST